jgi:hypothetical protein
MEATTFKRVIKRKLSPFCNEHGFSFYKPTILVRENETDVLQIINFDLLPDTFYCTVATQPLFIPNNSIVLTFGKRIGLGKTEIWNYGSSETDMSRIINDLMNAIESKGVSWFEEMSSVEKTVKYLCNPSKHSELFGMVPYMREMHIGFYQLYLGNYSLGQESFRKVLEILKPDDRQWVKELKNLLTSLISVAREEPTKLDTILSEFVINNKKLLKIK